MKYKFLIFLLLLSGSLLAQDYEGIQTGPATVISTTGLSLRAGPGSSHKRIDTAPHGAKVTVLEQMESTIDSLPRIYTKPSSDDASGAYHVSRIGTWARVSYKGKIGYMLDIFLKSDAVWDTEEELVGLNKDYLVLYPGSGCQDNFVYDPSFHWYGLYCTYDGQMAELRPVKVSQWIQRSEIFTNHFYAEDMSDLLMIIGSREKLPERKIGKAFNHGDFSPYVHGVKYDDMHDPMDAVAFEVEQKTMDEGYVKTLLYLPGSPRQLLNPSSYDYFSPNSLRFAGDIDGDGKQDYLIHWGESSGSIILYLSSEAGKGEQAKPVAGFYMGYCC